MVIDQNLFYCLKTMCSILEKAQDRTTLRPHSYLQCVTIWCCVLEEITLPLWTLVSSSRKVWTQ